MSEPITFEHLEVGRVYRSASIEVTADEIVQFARRYDPQPFHVDAALAEKTVFAGLVASGWLTASLTMRLMVTGEFHFGHGVVGLGVESLRWPAPVRPGDWLTANVQVLAKRVSESRPTFGVVRLQTLTTNQRNETVQELISNILIPRRRSDRSSARGGAA
jgi:acyl dehydratase